MYKLISYNDYFPNFMILATLANTLVMAMDNADGTE